jgi:hypothetical protein
MKFTRLIVALLLLISSAANAQFTTNWDVLNDEGKPSQLMVSNFASVNEARTIIDDIISAVGIKANFEVREANVPNAAAVFYNNKRYILYNPTFIRQIDRIASNDWASISILAHEIGHHVKGHTFNQSGSSHKNELEADEFSGYALRKMGANLEDAQLAMNMIAGAASATHPGKFDRLAAIAKGYNSVGGTVNNNDVAVTKPASQPNAERTVVRTVPTQRTNNREALLDDRYILVNVNFTIDRNNEYFVTTRNNVVKWDGNNITVVGKVASTKNTNYPYYIYDSYKNYVLVSRNGYLVDPKGQKVGYLSMHTASTASR